jgi:hypothetical protein
MGSINKPYLCVRERLTTTKGAQGQSPNNLFI